MNEVAYLLIDARGLKCPLPALRLARHVRENAQGRYHLLTDDPAALKDIPSLCAERGWILEQSRNGEFWVIVSGV